MILAIVIVLCVSMAVCVVGLITIEEIMFYPGLILMILSAVALVFTGIDQGGQETRRKVEECVASNGVPSQISGTLYCTPIVDKQ